MTLITTPSPQSAPQPHDEHILVVQRDRLFPSGAWQGLQSASLDSYLTIISQHQEFLPRSIMETDPRYKQIIPYLIFKHDDRYFLMQRQAKASETRLQNKFSLGIGGHVRQEDLHNGTSLFDWARREFDEEVQYQGALTITPLGVLNDDSNAVGQVHLGLVLLLQGDSDNIKVKSELKSGTLTTVQECQEYFDRLESWSQMILPLLCKRSV